MQEMPRLRTLYYPGYVQHRTSAFRLWLRWLSFGVAAGCLAWVGSNLLEQYLYQRAAREFFEEGIERKKADEAATSPKPVTPVAPGTPLARLRIKRIAIDAMVQEGFDANTLRRAVGHAPSSAKPGQKGNVVLAAHRDTFFAGLREVKEGDLIDLESGTGRQDSYRVSRIFVVKPTDSWVMRSNPNKNLLTLITCYPFQYVGSAPNRLIVQAQPITSDSIQKPAVVKKKNKTNNHRETRRVNTNERQAAL
jgi:LPXTG-site transpeptidase (sortase) family protein